MKFSFKKVLGRAAAFSLLLIFSLGLLFTGCGKKEIESKEKEQSEKKALELQSDLYRKAGVSTDLSSYEIAYFTAEDRRETDTENAAPLLESDGPLRIIDYGPVEELPSEVHYPEVYVLFSQPMVPLAKLGEPMRDSSVFSIDPPLEGVYRWRGSRLLVFQAEEKIISQRLYRVAVSSSLSSLGGKTLEHPLSFGFRTEYLDLINFYAGKGNADYSQSDVPLEDAKEIHCTFNYPVDPEVLGKYITIKGSEDERGEVMYPFLIRRPKNQDGQIPSETLNTMAVLRIQENLPENTNITVHFEAGTRSFSDALPIPDPIVRSYTTIKPFEYDHYDTYSWSFPRSEKKPLMPVYLNFTHPLEPETVKGALTYNGGTEIGTENLDIWNRSIRISGLPFEHEGTYTITLGKEIGDKYGRSLNRTEKVRITLPPAERYSYFPDTGIRMLEAQFPAKIVWEYQNVFDGVWKAGKIDNPLSFYKPSELVPYDFSEAVRNKPIIEVFDFSKWLNPQGYGWVAFAWNFGELNSRGERSSWQQRNLTLQVTDLGVTLRYGYNKLLALVTSLSTGEPVTDAEVFLLREGRKVKTASPDNNGLATFHFRSGEYRELFGDRQYSWKDHLVIGVERGPDRIRFVPNESHNNWKYGVYNTLSPIRADQGRMETYLFTDRGLYKPGETISFMGRDLTFYPGEMKPYQERYTITAKSNRYDAEPVFTESGETTARGGFSGSFTIPSDAGPGYYTLFYTRKPVGKDESGGRRQIGFQVAFFRRAGFELTVEDDKKLYFTGDTLSWRVKAGYLSGGRVSSGKWDYYWTREPAYFSPGGESWGSYTFCPRESAASETLNSDSGSLDAAGTFQAVQKTGGEDIPGMPYAYSLEASVNDLSNQEIATRKGILVHPTNVYIGAKFGPPEDKGSPYFLTKGEEQEVSIVLLRPSGEEIKKEELPEEIKAKLYRVEWKLAQQEGVGGSIYTNYERVDKKIDAWTISVKKSGTSTTVVPKEAGVYFLRLTTSPPASAAKGESPAVTDLSFYATGSGWVNWGMDYSDGIDLEPEKDLYSPGETAEIVCKTPIPEGRYLVTVEREGILEERVEYIEGSAQTISIPIRESYVPQVFVSVASYSVRTGEPSHTYYEPDLDKPQGYFGILPLKIDPAGRDITCTIGTDKEAYQPGEEVRVVLRAESKDGPVKGAELSFLAVDRGVLDLIDYHIPDPLDFFYDPSRYPLGVKGADSRSLLIDPVTYEVKQLKGGDGDGKMGAQGGPDSVAGQDRKDFNPTAAFVPSLITDNKGEAEYTFTLPDTLTTYRMTAVAAAGESFGLSEKEMVVQNPLNVKPSFPSLLRLRDTAVGTVLLTNLTESPVEAEVSITTDLLRVGGESKKGISVPGGTTLAVPFKILAVDTGRGKVTIHTTSKVHSEKVSLEIPVEKPLVTEGFTTTGETEQTVEEGIVIPYTQAANLGFLELTVGGSRIGEAKEAVDYLLSYPFDCIEQETAKIIPLLAFDNVGSSFFGLEEEEREERVEELINLLGKIQNEDGGFPFWPDRRWSSSYFISVRVAHTLAMAVKAGYSLSNKLSVPMLLSYLQHPPAYVRKSSYLTTYALYARALWGEPVKGEALRAAAMGDALGMSGYALLGLTYEELGERKRAKLQLDRIKQFLKPGAQTVELVETREAGRLYDSPLYDSPMERLSLAMLLFEKLRPEGEMITRLSKTISLKLHGGRPLITSYAVWAVLAYSELPELAEEKLPDFTALVTLEGSSLLKGEIEGVDSLPLKSTLRFDEEPIADKEREELLPLRFEKNGRGTLYYTATMRYAIPTELISARDEGISVYSSITDVDGNPVTAQELKPGKTFSMHVTLSSPRERDFLALRVPVPSGAEILNASFTTSKRYGLQTEEGDGTGEGRSVGGRKRILEKEVQFVWDTFPTGKEEISFLFRTVHSGVYPLPPAQAECMYEPEVFGRDRGRIFIITAGSNE